MAIDLMLSVIFFGRKWEMPVEFLDVSPNKLFPIAFLVNNQDAELPHLGHRATIST